MHTQASIPIRPRRELWSTELLLLLLLHFTITRHTTTTTLGEWRGVRMMGCRPKDDDSFGVRARGDTVQTTTIIEALRVSPRVCVNDRAGDVGAHHAG